MRKVLVLSHGVNNANPSFCAGKKNEIQLKVKESGLDH